MHKVTFEAGLERARDSFTTSTGRIAALGLFTDYARMVFNIHKGRADFLKDYTSDEIRGYTYLFPDLQAYIDKRGPREGFWRWTRSLPRKVNRLLYQQLIVFLVTILETFIADALLLVFLNEPRCLSSSRAMSWEKTIELGDYNSIINYFASQKVADVLSGDWDKIVDEFEKLFNIKLSPEIEGKSVVEIFEIRHVVVHNAGIVDQKFMTKVRASEWGLRYDLNKEIILNHHAVERMTSYAEYTVETIYQKLLDKFDKS